MICLNINIFCCTQPNIDLNVNTCGDTIVGLQQLFLKITHGHRLMFLLAMAFCATYQQDITKGTPHTRVPFPGLPAGNDRVRNPALKEHY